MLVEDLKLNHNVLNTKNFVCICLVTYNNYKDTEECLKSLDTQTGGPYPIYIVDNGSTDETLSSISSKHPNVILTSLSTNHGFAYGANVGLRLAMKNGFKYCLLLNNDTIAERSMVQQLLKTANEHFDCAIVMPKILYYPPEKSITDRKNIWSDGSYYRKFPPAILLKDKRRGIAFEIPRNIDFAVGCALLIRSSSLKNVGLFDERYFFFFEDWDFSWRTRKAGYSIFVSPQAILWHKVSKSTKKNVRLYWEKMGESLTIFTSTHLGSTSKFFFKLYAVLRDFIFKPKNLQYLPSFLKGFRSGKINFKNSK